MSTLGRFENVSMLGRGTYGTVFMGTDVSRAMVFAFKRMTVASDDEGVPATAIREIFMLKDLRHDNIVALYETLFDSPKITLIFERCDCDLKAYIEDKGGCLPREEVQVVLKQLLNGLAFLHAHSVVHRDLKLQNIFLNVRNTSSMQYDPSLVNTDCAQSSENTTTATSPPNGNSGPECDKPNNTVGANFPIVKLGDFGLARVENLPVKKYSHEVVTLWYRSPDVLMGSALYSFPVDMWSTGAIFFEMVTGKVLFKGHNENEQVLSMFEILGSPTVETWRKFGTYPGQEARIPAVRDVALKKLAREDVLRAASSPSDPANTLGLPKELWFPQGKFTETMRSSGFEAVCGTHGIDLLRRCLQYDPDQRITAAEALQHPYLRSTPLPSPGSSTISNAMVLVQQALSARLGTSNGKSKK